MTRSVLGTTVQRREDPSLLDGSDLFVDDLRASGLGFVNFVRSPVAHGRINSIAVHDALEMPGVIGVYTSAELDLPAFQSWGHMSPAFARPPLAVGKVRFVGDILAAVVAEDRASGEDAAEAIWSDIEVLPAHVDAERALLPGAALLFDTESSNLCYEVRLNPTIDPLVGADHVVELDMVSQRLAGAPMEPNGILALPGEEGSLTVWISSQNPLVVRHELAPLLGLETSQLRVVTPAVGGGFGPKSHNYAEFTITAALALRLNRPLRWTETRSENMVALTHGRAMKMHGRLGMSAGGRMTGLDVEVVVDAGAYPALGGYLVKLTQLMSQGVYDIASVRFSGRSAATNTTPTGPYRGAGRPEAAQLLERLVDIAADDLGIDPAEIRRRNFLPGSSFPAMTQTGASYDSGDYGAALDAALAAAGYDELCCERERRRRDGCVRLLGVGVASYVEVTAPDGTHIEFGGLEVCEDGSVVVRVGTSAHGQGHVTSFSMIVSATLGVAIEDVIVLQSDSALIPHGSGTFGSRSLQTAGSALQVAADVVRDRAKKLAAHLMEAEIGDVVVGDGVLHVAGVPARAMSWSELARAAKDPGNLPPEMIEGLSHHADFDQGGSSFPFGAHVAVVEVDVETGAVELLRHIAVDDCGRILNPTIVRGQQHGGIAQGAAQALLEAIVYDGDGNPKSTNFTEYLVPSAADLPSFEAHNTETPTPRNPLGAKGIGESGTIGSTPAIQNAVIDAVSHLGVKHLDMPLGPEVVWRAIQSANASQAGGADRVLNQSVYSEGGLR